VSHPVNVDAPANRHSSPTSGAGDRFTAAWRAGNAAQVGDALATDAILTLPSSARAFSPADMVTSSGTELLSRTEPSLVEVGPDGRIRGVVLTPIGTEPSQSITAGVVESVQKGLTLPQALMTGGLGTALGWSARLLTIVAVIIGTLAAAAPILDAAYAIWPGLRPAQPAAVLGMTVSDVQLEERRVPCGGALCNLVSFDLQLVGYTGGVSTIEWAAFDPETERRVAIASDDAGNQLGPQIRTEAENDRLSISLPIPIPIERRCVFIRVYVFDDTNKTRTDYGDSQPFDTHSASEPCPPNVAS
jgi:hypothetical protein